MTIINSFSLPFEDRSNLISLGRKSSSKANSFVVLVGENGTRKSFLLRQLADAALAGIRKVDLPGKQKDKYGETHFSKLPSRVIAISAVPTDRFPAKAYFGEGVVSERYDNESYAYIGPRSSRNLISRNQSGREIIINALGAPERLIEKRAFLGALCAQIGASSNLVFGLNPSELGVTPSKKSRSFDAYVSTLLERFSDKSQYRKPAVAAKLRDRLVSEIGQAQIAEIDDRIRLQAVNGPGGADRSPHKSRFPVYVDFSSGLIDSQGVSLGSLHLALEAGYLRPTKFFFGDADQEQLSAGQWSLFSSMCSLALTATNDSLILIDEPEASLHPAWQRTYLENLQAALVGSTGSQVIVATHSPLMLSALPSKHARVIYMELSAEGNVVAHEVNAPVGWDSNSVLEDLMNVRSARSPALTDLVNEALHLLGKGRESNLPRLKSLLPKLRTASSVLPIDDPLVSTIAAIQAVVEEN